MTYEDLNIDLTGPRYDGRVLPDKEQKMAGNVLKYGVGLPKGNPDKLVWNSENIDR